MPRNVAETPFFEPSPISYILDPARPLLIRSQTLIAGRIVRPHAHPRGQYAWAKKGVLRIISDHCVWIVPPTHAVWIPSGTRHQVASETPAEVRHVFVDPSRSVRTGAQRPHRCAVLAVTPLMRELTLRLETLLVEETDEARRLRFCDVMIDELDRLAEAPLSLPGGRDSRLVRLTRHLGEHPEDRRPLAELASFVGASTRTLERLFAAETGLTYRRWRARLRLLTAIERLERGESVTEVALTLGYSSPSAFTASFREEFGEPPRTFLQGQTRMVLDA
ncbi:helix-turn-helix transcriptional regulator [Pleomorphomonas sp. NRK KF1]|uniref:AraC family transcriptional regulator n=1 Tax=Pleomorphomonas sp. NRK KF1 TaxID=2943000 RepID=UPI002042C260|nr:helix-turn-helix transcriptional regulator [Pleomorphomonas sp. NRK KF1]MCM5552263.1 helix-turn-helix transcriptional regulator [Pleomorphomonas sp. NRK KF1]